MSDAALLAKQHTKCEITDVSGHKCRHQNQLTSHLEVAAAADSEAAAIYIIMYIHNAACSTKDMARNNERT